MAGRLRVLITGGDSFLADVARRGLAGVPDLPALQPKPRRRWQILRACARHAPDVAIVFELDTGSLPTMVAPDEEARRAARVAEHTAEPTVRAIRAAVPGVAVVVVNASGPSEAARRAAELAPPALLAVLRDYRARELTVEGPG
jgi:hypothetical protein